MNSFEGRQEKKERERTTTGIIAEIERLRTRIGGTEWQLKNQKGLTKEEIRKRRDEIQTCERKIEDLKSELGHLRLKGWGTKNGRREGKGK